MSWSGRIQNTWDAAEVHTDRHRRKYAFFALLALFLPIDEIVSWFWFSAVPWGLGRVQSGLTTMPSPSVPDVVRWILALVVVVLLLRSEMRHRSFGFTAPARNAGQDPNALPVSSLRLQEDRADTSPPTKLQTTPALQEEPQQETKGRTFIVEPVESVIATPPDATGVQIERAKAVYIGKWLRVSGPLDTLMPFGSFYQATLRGQLRNAYFYFKPDWGDRLEHLKPGQVLTLVGRVRQIDSAGTLHLEECELESVKALAESEQAKVQLYLEPHGAGGTPGIYVRLLNKSADTFEGVIVRLTDIRLWNQDYRAWVTTREIHGSGSVFPCPLRWGKVTLHPSQPAEAAFIRAGSDSFKRVEVNGHPEAGTNHCRFTMKGIYRLSCQIVIPSVEPIEVICCFTWGGKVAVPVDCPS